MRAGAVAWLVLVAAACDCAASHERTPRDGGVDAASPTDAGQDALGWTVAPRPEVARSESLMSFSVTAFWDAIVVAWTRGDSLVHISSSGAAPEPRGTLDVGPGDVRSLHLIATSPMDRTLALAYELLTPAGSLEAWLALIDCA